MKISSPRFSQSIDFEVPLLPYNQANQSCLFLSGTAAQAGSLGAIVSFGHERLGSLSVFLLELHFARRRFQGGGPCFLFHPALLGYMLLSGFV